MIKLMMQIYGKYFKGGSETESFSRAMIYEEADAADVVKGEVEERGAFSEILAEEAVGVFDGALFPGVVWLGEEVVGSEGVGDSLMAGEFPAVVEGECMEDGLERSQRLHHGAAYDAAFEGGHEGSPEEAGGAVYHGDDVAGAAAADNSVDLDVADAQTGIHLGGTLRDVAAVGDKAAVVVLVGPLLPLPAAVAQVLAKMAVTATCAVDPAVESLVAHHVDALQAAAPRYLLRTPLFLYQFLPGKLLHLVCEADPLGLLAHPFLVFFMSQGRVVAQRFPVAVAAQLPVHSASAYAQITGNLRLGKIVFQHPRNFVPLHFGKMFHLLFFWKEHKSKHFSAIKGEAASFLRFSFEILKAYALPFPVFAKSVAFIS